MAIDYASETVSTEKQVEKLAAANSYTSNHLSDQLIFHFGTTNRSEILGIIGDTGQTFQKQFNDYLDSL